MSIGRAPRSGEIGLEGSGVEVDDRGFVVVDGHMRTAVPGVFAVGDVVDEPALAHVGVRRGDRRRSRRSSASRSRPIDYDEGARGASTATRRSRSCGLTEERGHARAATTSSTAVHRARRRRAGADHRRDRRDGEARRRARRPAPRRAHRRPVGHRAARRGVPRGELGGHPRATSPRSSTRTRPSARCSARRRLSLTGRSLHPAEPERTRERVRGRHDAAARGDGHRRDDHALAEAGRRPRRRRRAALRGLDRQGRLRGARAGRRCR